MSRIRSRLSQIGAFSLMLVLVYLTFWAGYRRVWERVHVEVDWASGGAYRYSARLEGEELLLVFIGASTCLASNDSRLPRWVEGAKASVAAKAEAAGLGFATAAIGLDRDATVGTRFLRKFGRFDEVSSGRAWVNMGAARYLFETLPGAAATPTVLVSQRTILRDSDSVTIADERLLLRKVGLVEIGDWIGSGAVLPKVAATFVGPQQSMLKQ
jgi:hypothetical protein